MIFLRPIALLNRTCRNPILKICNCKMHTNNITLEELKYQNFIDDCLEKKMTFCSILLESKKAFGEFMPLNFFVDYMHKIRLDLENITDMEDYWTKYTELLNLDDLFLFDYNNKMTLKDNAVTICQEYISDISDENDTSTDYSALFEYRDQLFIGILALISFISIRVLASKMKDDSTEDKDTDKTNETLNSAYEEYFNSLSPAKYLILFIIPVLFLHLFELYQIRKYYYYRMKVFYQTVLRFPQAYLQYLKYLYTQLLYYFYITIHKKKP